MFIAPLIGMVPPQATAPALIIVGWLMISVLSEREEEAEAEEGVVSDRRGGPRALAGIDFGDVAIGLSAAIVMMFMPFTFSITDGIAAGFIVYVVIRLFQGQWARVHPLMYVAAGAFTLVFLVPLRQENFDWI